MNGTIEFMTQRGEVKVLNTYYDEEIPRLGGGYNRDDILCIAGQHVDWEAVEEYGWDINHFTKPTWAN